MLLEINVSAFRTTFSIRTMENARRFHAPLLRNGRGSGSAASLSIAPRSCTGAKTRASANATRITSGADAITSACQLGVTPA